MVASFHQGAGVFLYDTLDNFYASLEDPYRKDGLLGWLFFGDNDNLFELLRGKVTTCMLETSHGSRVFKQVDSLETVEKAFRKIYIKFEKEGRPIYKSEEAQQCK